MRVRTLVAAAMLAASFTLMPAVAFHTLAATAPAASDTVAVTTPATVAVPYGDWITLFLGWARDGLLALASLAVARFAPAAIKTLLTEQVLGRAIDYAIAAIDGAVKGRAVDLTTTNLLLAAAEKYVVANAPKLAKSIGDMLRPKLLARLGAAGVVSETTTAAQVGVTLGRAG